MLAQVCSYKYTDANININILEGDDRLRADCLKDLWCPQLDMGFYLAKLERIEGGGGVVQRSASSAIMAPFTLSTSPLEILLH